MIKQIVQLIEGKVGENEQYEFIKRVCFSPVGKTPQERWIAGGKGPGTTSFIEGDSMDAENSGDLAYLLKQKYIAKKR